MALLQPNLNPSGKDLRWFAGIWFPAFWALAGLLVMRRLHAPVAACSMWGAASLLAIAGLIAPAVIRPVYLAMMRATYPVGWVMSHVVLILAYFVVITPIGWLVRLFHDPLQRKFDRSVGSYWVAWESSDRERYFRQM